MEERRGEKESERETEDSTGGKRARVKEYEGSTIRGGDRCTHAHAFIHMCTHMCNMEGVRREHVR